MASSVAGASARMSRGVSAAESARAARVAAPSRDAGATSTSSRVASQRRPPRRDHRRPARRGVVAAASGEDAPPAAAPPAADDEDTALVDAQIRAERMAVRLKLQSAGARRDRPSLDAAIVRAGGAASSSLERAAVRARMQRFSISRYGYVRHGANAGRIVDKLTGEALSVDDEFDDRDNRSVQERVDLARELVKQAEQARAEAESELEARRARLTRLSRELDDARATAARDEAALRSSAAGAAGAGAEERRLTRASLEEKPVAAPPRVVASKATLRRQTTAAAAAAAASEDEAGDGDGDVAGSSESDGSASSRLRSREDEALSRASAAIRARASSSLSRLRKRQTLKRGQRKVESSRPAAAPATTTTTTAATAAAEDDDDCRDEGSDGCVTSLYQDPVNDPSRAKFSSLGSAASNAPSTRAVLPKPVFVLSDCTGESAANTCRAALTQFEDMNNLEMPTNFYVFRFLSEESDVYKIVQQAKEDDALVVHTLSDAAMATAVATACKLYDVKSVNLWGRLLTAMEEHLDMNRTGVPLSAMGRGCGVGEDAAGGSRPRRGHAAAESLSNDYYKLIEAVEFTRQMDDGARPERWKDADILILGVSRTGKTPLSIYLGQRGYKVANLPLVPRDGKLMVPQQISDVDPSRVFGLLIDGDVLHSIRTNRLSSIGVRTGGADAATNARREYSAMRQVTQELSLAKALYARNPEWEVLDVTHRGVEETAAKILRKMFTSENANNFQGMVST